jgi:hypothetical protein
MSTNLDQRIERPASSHSMRDHVANTRNPGYGGSTAPQSIGSKVIRVPLRADDSDNFEAMIKSDPAAGVYYVRSEESDRVRAKEIDYLVANENKGAVVVVDEEPASHLVAAAADRDLIVLRTFGSSGFLLDYRCCLRHGQHECENLMACPRFQP